MPDTNLLIPVGIFVVTTLVVFAGGAFLIRGGRNNERAALGLSFRRAPIFGRLTEALAGVVPSTEAGREKLARQLRHAGYYRRLAVVEYLALRNALAVGWLILAAATFVVIAEPGVATPWWFWIAAAAGTVAFLSMPRLILDSQAAGRLRRIEASLPDALDMITMCTSGGLPVQRALTRVSDELDSTHPDLAFELRVLGRQTEAGSVETAVRQLAHRIDTPDVQSLAAMIGQTERQGTGVAAAFHEFADTVRQTRRQRADEMGNKTAVKMLFPLVFCLAPPVYIMLLTPAVVELTQFVDRENRPGGVISASTDVMSTMLATDASDTAGEGLFAPPTPEAAAAATADLDAALGRTPPGRTAAASK